MDPFLLQVGPPTESDGFLDGPAETAYASNVSLVDPMASLSGSYGVTDDRFGSRVGSYDFLHAPAGSPNGSYAFLEDLAGSHCKMNAGPAGSGQPNENPQRIL